MSCFARTALICLLVTGSAQGAFAAGPSVKEVSSPPPEELAAPVRALMSPTSYQVTDGKGQVLCEIWFCQDLPSKATPEQIKKGVTYRELEESALVGAVRFTETFTDYRKQKIKPGIYTLRLGFQPMNGDHMGTSPYPEFCLLSPAKLDTKTALMETKELHEMSAKSTGASHPAIMLLHPPEKAEDKPQIVDKGSDTWVLAVKRPVTAGKEKSTIGLALTVVGHTSAE